MFALISLALADLAADADFWNQPLKNKRLGTEEPAQRALVEASPEQREHVIRVLLPPKARLAVHRQLRDESRMTGLKYDVRPQFATDVLGVYVLLPAGP